MDRGTNAATVLKNQVVPLRLGYVGKIFLAALSWLFTIAASLYHSSISKLCRDLCNTFEASTLNRDCSCMVL